jgi:hypothetical protein
MIAARGSACRLHHPGNKTPDGRVCLPSSALPELRGPPVFPGSLLSVLRPLLTPAVPRWPLLTAAPAVAGGAGLQFYPKGACPPDFMGVLRQHKGELLAWLNRPPCPGWQAVPPADLPLNPLRPQPAPLDRERVTGYMWRQTGDRTGPLTAWLVTRENDYFTGPGGEGDCGLITYAAARDAACWQLQRVEPEVWDFLAAIVRQRAR